MKTPSKALILAAGFGIRIRPLSFQTPKTLLPVWGKPLLHHTLTMLERWGVKDVLINLHHNPAPIMDFLRERESKCRINLSFEPAILGTGGALSKARWFLDDSHFWIINGDVAADLEPDTLIRTCERARPLAALWLTDSAGPRTVEMKDGQITTFKSARSGAEDTYTLCGLHLALPQLLDYVPDGSPYSIVDAYTEAIKNGHTVCGVCVPRSFWADIGSMRGYLDAHRDVHLAHGQRLPGRRLFDQKQTGHMAALRKSGVTINGFAAIGENVQVARNSIIENAVIWNQARIFPGARLTDAIIADGAVARGNISGIALRAEAMRNPMFTMAIKRLGWPTEDTTVIQLAARGSARDFYRIQNRTRTAILVEYSLERPENGLYSQNARFLRRIGARVPKILVDSREDRMLVMEDVGDSDLLGLVQECLRDISPDKDPPTPGYGEARIRRYNAAKILSLYRKAIESALPLHRIDSSRIRASRLTLCEPFSPIVYRWERELFAEHFLKNRLELPPFEIKKIMSELRSVEYRLRKERMVLIHRDFQSTNVLFHHGEPALIDFQGMRLGPAMYDLASLLCDPYVSLPLAAQEELIDFYATKMRLGMKHARQVFWWAAVERLVQAIGAFGRLGARPETVRYNRYFRPALEMLDRALNHVDNLSHLRRIVCYTSDGAKEDRI